MVLSVRRIAVAVFQAAGLLVVSTWVGCQSGTPVSSRQLIEHQALIDFSGLKKDEQVPWVKTTIATPRRWEVMPRQSNPLYAHQQWRSPSTHTGVGILYARLPLPLSAKTVVWFAKQQYAKKDAHGKILNEWVDSVGRSWFEAENERFHIRGYVVVQGFGAWVVYFGYRTKYPPDLGEISLAARSAETAVPVLDDTTAPATQPAEKTQ
jgi:hypothetical protein